MFPLRDYNPSSRTPLVTRGLIAVNIAVFIYQLSRLASGGEQAYVALVMQLGAIPDRILAPDTWSQGPFPAPLTLITAMFVHGDIFHIAGNMLYLWVFGDNVEDRLGHGRYLLFYALCGLAAAGLQIALMPSSDVPMVGASGAIAGVLGGYLLLFPGAQVLTLVFIVFFVRIMVLPAVLLLGLWFLIQVVSAANGSEAGVAWYAHIGGFVAGLALVKPMSRRRTGSRR